MAFFEPPPPPEPEDEPAFSERPSWHGPPSSVIGASVPLAPLILARTDRVAVAVIGATAYPTGFKCFMTARWNSTVDARRQDGLGRDLFMMQRFPHVTRGSELPGELLRFGVQFADGRKATNVDAFPDFDEEPTGAVMTPGGGGGSSAAWSQSYWVFPLPPPGALAFVCEWPAFDVPLTRSEIDAGLVIDAAGRAERLWDEPEGGGTARLTGWFTSEP